MSNGEGGTPSTLTYAARVGTALKRFFLGGVIRSGGDGSRSGRGSANPFLGGWGATPNGETMHEPNGLKRKRRWSGSGLRRGMSEEALARRAALKVFRVGARTLKQSLGSPLRLAPSTIVAKMKGRTTKGNGNGNGGNMSGLPGVTVTTHNGVRK